MANSSLRGAVFLLVSIVAGRAGAGEAAPGPYDRQVGEKTAVLSSGSEQERAAAAEALGFLRAYGAEPALIRCMDDPSVEVRRQAAMALAWCGGRNSVGPLLGALDDPDWIVRQAAYVSLTNLTGMEFPFDSQAAPEDYSAQAAVWRKWWEAVPPDRPPKEALELLAGPRDFRGDRSVSVSSTYKGPPEVLVDGGTSGKFWQTKNVPFPQWCTIDLGRPTTVTRVVIHQYGPQHAMTEYSVSTSLDNETFEVVRREKGPTPKTLVVDFPVRNARYIQITSFDAVNRTYPTTFFEIEIPSTSRPHTVAESREWRWERGLRALGALGGRGATAAVIEFLGDPPPDAPPCRPMSRAGIRSLGRLREEAGYHYLVRLLEYPFWARYAAAALGDFGDRRAVAELLSHYPRYAKQLSGADPKDVPRDDKMGFPSEDRMLETAYEFELALSRLPLDDPRDLAALRALAPLILVNMQGDHDTHLLYEPEPGHLITRHLLETAGLRQEACEQVMLQLGQRRRVPRPSGSALVWPKLAPYRMASMLPAVCTDKRDLPRLVALLDHEEGWVRLNAAKTLARLGDPRAIKPLAERLKSAKAEADYGWNATFKNEEFDDPAPRCREGLIRALGLLGANDQTDLIVSILNDERSVLEIRHAAAEALADLGNDRAMAALREAARHHSFYSVRHIARDALRVRGIELEPDEFLERPSVAPEIASNELETTDPRGLEDIEAIVFIKGSNIIPNTSGTVEQADRWRQTYVVTDSGPVYRPGRNLYTLRPPRPDGRVTPLTRFVDGYVGEPEVSWDGRKVIFTHREQDNPWWHLFQINVDGTGLKQLTYGPYHAAGPAWLPDGRIVFASSRSGIRDEYHGYPCTALHIMNPDGSDIHPIATNIGRDNEPAILNDGRIVFSRLEVFYSRNKTELTLHSVLPDGTRDTVLYGPERRQFWRDLDHGPKTPADGQEAPLTHRVIRMTQPQPMPDGRHIIVVTQGGLILVGPRRDTETFVTHDNKTRSYTTPFPLPDGSVLCASTLKVEKHEDVDLGLYLLDPATGGLKVIYNDPATADFEPRPVMARARPPVRPPGSQRGAYSGRFLCSSVFQTQEEQVRERGRLVRLIEGVPIVARHSTHTNKDEVWKNHGGTFARVLGTAPLMPDGSFFVEAPADRLLHFQVLDSDRRVVGNQLTWIYPRPGETKSCIGCHEQPHSASGVHLPMAMREAPVDFLPKGDEFTYRAKAWFKGSLPPEIEERTRTARAVNLLGR